MAGLAPLSGRSSAATTIASWPATSRAFRWDGVGSAEWTLAGAHLLLGLVGKRRVDDAQQLMVLPHAEPKRQRDRGDRDDQPRAQLAQVVDEAEPLLIADAADGNSHVSPSSAI
ncbi:MAG TPA: hypothetical protein VHY18_13680 [Solirubrobacteraceae bacterium]|nr:hypothetical protein [Solirubrobacteraceae bacterium]